MWSDDEHADSGFAASTSSDTPFARHGPRRHSGVNIVDDDSDVDYDHAHRHPSRRGSEGQKRRGSLFDSVTAEIIDKTEGATGGIRNIKTRFVGFELSDSCTSPVSPSHAQMRSSGRRKSTVEDVRATAKRRHTVRLERLHDLRDKANKRHEVAQSRRLFLETKRDAQSACMWMSILGALVFADRANHCRHKHYAAVLFNRMLAPIVHLKRERIVRKRAHKATLAEHPIEPLQLHHLMNDKLLQLFGAVHLRGVLEHARPVFFAAGATIMYQGEEGQDCYVIMSGEVDIFITAAGADPEQSQQKLMTRGAGSVIGSIGMISGERRSARVRCATHVQAYVVWRKQFLHAAPDPSLMTKALAEVTRQHEQNMPSIYRDSLSGPSLTRFHLFKGIDPVVLSKLQDDFHAKVVRPGEVIVNAGEPPTKLILVMHGVVDFYRESRVPLTRAAVEAFANQSDILSNKDKPRRQMFLDAQSGKGTHVGSLGATCLLGGPLFFIMEPAALSVVARTQTDIMILSGQRFLQVLMSDPIVLHELRFNACRAMAAWVKPLTRQQLCTTIFQDVGKTPNSVINALRASRHHAFDVQPVVVNHGELLEFEPGSQDAYIIVSGSVESVGVQHPPYMWPQVPIVFFGNFITAVRVVSRIEAWRITRRNFLAVLRAVLDDDRLNHLFLELFSMYEHRIGKQPTFEDVRGVSIPNPRQGQQPPAPPPDRHGRAARHSTSQVIRDEQSSSMTTHMRRSSSGPASDPPSGDTVTDSADSYVTAPSTHLTAPAGTHRARKASIVVAEAARSTPPPDSVSAPKSADDTPPDDVPLPDSGSAWPVDTSRRTSRRSSGPQPQRGHLPILPASFRAGRGKPPMRRAIQEQVRKDRARLSPTRVRSPPVSPTRAVAHAEPATVALPMIGGPEMPVLKQDTGAQPAYSVSDPFARVFGDTDEAFFYREEMDRPAPKKITGRGGRNVGAHSLVSHSARGPTAHTLRKDAIRRSQSPRSGTSGATSRAVASRTV